MLAAMSDPDRALVVSVHLGYARSRGFYRLAAGAMTALTLALIAICVATGQWTSLAMVGVLFVPLGLYVGYRTFTFVGSDAVELLLASPARVTSLLKLVTPRTHVLGVELDDGRMVPLRFSDETELDSVRTRLAARSPGATVVPPLSG